MFRVICVMLQEQVQASMNICVYDVLKAYMAMCAISAVPQIRMHSTVAYTCFYVLSLARPALGLAHDLVKQQMMLACAPIDQRGLAGQRRPGLYWRGSTESRDD